MNYVAEFINHSSKTRVEKLSIWSHDSSMNQYKFWFNSHSYKNKKMHFTPIIFAFQSYIEITFVHIYIYISRESLSSDYIDLDINQRNLYVRITSQVTNRSRVLELTDWLTERLTLASASGVCGRIGGRLLCPRTTSPVE